VLVLPSHVILRDFVLGFVIHVATGDNRILFIFVMLLCGGITMLMHLVSGTTAPTESLRYWPELNTVRGTNSPMCQLRDSEAYLRRL